MAKEYDIIKALDKLSKQFQNQGGHFSHLRLDITELKTKFENYQNRYEEHREDNKEEHQQIIEQAKLTNGSVKELKLWKWFLMGAWAVVTIGFPILYTAKIENLKNEINNMVESEVISILEKNKIVEYEK